MLRIEVRFIILIKIILLLVSFLTLEARPIESEEIIVVDITSKDIGLDLKSQEEYFKNRFHRDAFRLAMADFLDIAHNKAKFIVIDMWFPDLINLPGEEALMKKLKLSTNVTIASGGIYKQKYEITHPKFATLVQEMGHILLNADDPEHLIFSPTLCGVGTNLPSPKLPCAKHLLQKHIALLAAEKYLGKELLFEPGDYVVMNRENFKPFLRINFSTFKKNPKIIQDKLVILINRPFPNIDMFKIHGKKNISGSEILAMMIVFYSVKLPEK
ncbi:MAG: hypothetical protein SFU98_19055 [Leptospiraceae bacterium]|nr:hypothetical protein [Leptospiraceae bacterium]